MYERKTMAINLNFERMGIDIKGDKAAEIATPMPVCKNMVDLFDFTDSNNKIWMDMYCKTGNTLEALKDRGVLADNIVAICPSKQSQLFACRKLYGQLLPEETVKIEIRSLNNYIITRRGQVYWISNWKDIVKNSSQDAYNLIKIVMKSEMEKAMGKFEINNIVMNPPYNNDLYLDFVTLAHKIATDSVVAITPAKWQTKGGDKNEQFRRNIVPYMSRVVYHPDCLDIFAISESSGVCYYLVSNDKHDTCEVTNISAMKPIINSTRVRSLVNEESLWNCGQDVVNKIQSSVGYKQYILQEILDNKKYTVNLNKQITKATGTSGCWDWENSCIKDSWIGKGGVLFTEDGTIVLPNAKIITDKHDNSSATSINVFTSDSADEIRSFLSWINTKFIRFLLLINIGSLTMMHARGWRFVPDPGSFDHIFTDQELYQKYNLTPDEINIIESVIKERKEK